MEEKEGEPAKEEREGTLKRPGTEGGLDAAQR